MGKGGKDGKGVADRDRGGRGGFDGEKGSRFGFNGDRDERNDRSDRGYRAEKGDWGDRYDRDGKDNRADRNDRGKGEKGDRGERSDRGDRGDRYDRDDRADRNDRGYKGEKGDRSDRVDRYVEKSERGGKGGRDYYDKGGRDGYEGGKKGNRDNFEGGKGGRESYSNEKGDRKGDDKGKAKGKGKSREEKIVARGMRGMVIQLIKDKPSGFIQRTDGERDVYFDFVDVEGGETVNQYDPVEFDMVEGGGQRLYAARVKRLPKDAPLDEGRALKATGPATASAAGSLTGGLLGTPTLLGPGGASKAKSSAPGKLTGGGLSLRPGGMSLTPGGGLGLSSAEKKRDEAKTGAAMPSSQADEISTGQKDVDGQDGFTWGRVVSVRSGWGFLQPIGQVATKEDLFFRAADVVGMSGTDPGEDKSGLKIVLPHGRNSHGHKNFWLNPDDEVSYVISNDHTGKPCAVDIIKEKKGAWRTGRRSLTGHRGALPKKGDNIKDQLNRLQDMDADELLQNASLLRDVLENSEFNPSHLYAIVSMLAASDLVEDTRSDPLYRLFLDSKVMHTTLRTAIIKQSTSGRHSGTFLEECSRLIVELVLRASSPGELRYKLPLAELVEAWEQSVREGSSSTRNGLPESVSRMLLCLQKHFPEDVKLDRIMGTRAKKVARTAAEEYTELLEADWYEDMPILPTSHEMLGQCAFEIEANMRTYEKCEDFIHTHFMLLREDYIEPLRAGIKLFMQGKHSPKDLHVYTGIKVIGILSTWEGLVYRIQLEKSQTRRINWEKTKQLMYGSLLCFSADNFESLIWATVWRRDEHLIATEGQLDVRLPFEPFDDQLAPGKSFCCIENVTIYFEAYRYVLVALQSMRPTDVPFQDMLLHPSPDPMPPTFLTATNDMFHFHNVFHCCEKPDATVQAPKTFKILQNWPDTLQKSLDIDPSQLAAVKHALTNQIALIQGPPGTGKTWVGLRIVQALLDNTTHTRGSPMLVVCYTNHALDQFLEGIFNFCGRVARIGSRSKSEALKSRNLKDLVYEVQPSKEYFHARKGLMERRNALREQLESLLQDVNRQTVLAEGVQELMSERQFRQFYDGFLEYMGDAAKKFPEDACEIDEDIWDRIMHEWLETDKDLSRLCPLAATKVGGLPPPSAVAGLDDSEEEDDEEDAVAKEARNNEEEEQKAERDLTEKRVGGDDQEVKKNTGDFLAELPNPWLPSMEDHYDKLSPDMRTMDWREEADLWRLPLKKKREIYRQWLLEVHHEARQCLPELSQQLERNALHRAALERDRKLGVLREMDFVGMTTTAVSKYQVLLKELRPEIVIVEEAAEVLEAHILTALHPRTQHVVLIGDHQQLRPGTAVYRLAKHFNLDISLFERLIKNGCEHVTLLQQRRMHPKISRLIKPLYPELRDHQSTNNYPDVMGIDARCFFLKHDSYEDDEGESHSKTNSHEVNIVAALAAFLVKSGYEDAQITVLSPYLGQVRNLKNRIRRDPTTQGVAVQAVDNFQGEENDIIIVSLVRSNRTKTMGFLAVENRINVALTRAKHGMIIVGNANMLHGHKLWSAIMNELQTDNCIGNSLPLVEMESGARIDVKTSDDIAVILGDPLHESGGTLSLNFREAGGAVADRWAELGRDEGKGKDRARGQRDRDGDKADRNFASSSGGKGRDRGDRGNGRDRRGSDERYSKEDQDIMPGPDARPFQESDRHSSRAKQQPQREVGNERDAPPPSRMQGDGVQLDCELLPGRENGEAETTSQQKSGKKQKQKAGNKVVMRWG